MGSSFLQCERKHKAGCEADHSSGGSGIRFAERVSVNGRIARVDAMNAELLQHIPRCRCPQRIRLGHGAETGLRELRHRALGVAALLVAAAAMLAGCNRAQNGSTAEQRSDLSLAADALREATHPNPEGTSIERGQEVVLGTADCSSATCFSCFQCHGVRGEGSALAQQPRLAGQVYEYLYSSLRSFAAGTRPNPTMHSVAMTLTDQQMRDVAAYFAALPPEQFPTLVAIKAADAPSDEVLKEGRVLAETGAAAQGVPACGTCHGPQGGGMPPLYPALAGQYPAYLESQLRAFRDGTRGGDPGGVMHTVARGMTDEQIIASAQFYAASQPVRSTPQRTARAATPSKG